MAIGDGLGSVGPFDGWAGLGQVERVGNVGKGRDQIHGVADDQRAALVAVLRAVGKRPGELQIARTLPALI